MRNLFILIVVVAAGYLAYSYYNENYAPKPETAAEPAATTPAPLPSATPAPLPGTTPPAFVSRIDMGDAASGEKQLAPPGIFYMLDRTSVETKTGIHAVVPGDQVRLLKRNSDGTLKLTDGKVDFEAKQSQVTNDLQLAREAERKDFLRTKGRR